MGLYNEAKRQAKNASRHMSLMEKAPDSHHAETHSDSRGIAGCKDSFAVSKKKAD
jgi:hypothetical protein